PSSSKGRHRHVRRSSSRERPPTTIFHRPIRRIGKRRTPSETGTGAALVSQCRTRRAEWRWVVMMSELLHAALAFRARGWHVFPTRGKVPVTARGHLDATTDPEQIAAWWRRCPWAGIGLACRPSGLVVVDIDPRNGGDDSLHDLERQHGTLPETPTSGTG